MKYCDVTDVEAYFYGKKFDCDGWLTTQEVDNFISTQAQVINTYLRSKYTLPLTNSNDLLFMKLINEYLVVAIIDGMDRIEQKAGDTTFIRPRNLGKKAEDWLAMIKCGKMRLESSGKGSNIKFNVTDSEGNTVEKRFKDAFTQPVTEILDRESRNYVVVTE